MTPTLPLLAAAVVVAGAAAADPFAWLEDIHSPRSLAWVAAENAKTSARLESDPRYQQFHAEALTLLTASDRIAEPGFLGRRLDNFWQD